MRFGCVLLLAASAGAHALVVEKVFLNGQGPYRMLVDTGNASSIVRPGIARRLHLKAAYSVDQASVAGTRRVPAAILDEVRVGAAVDRSVEAIIGDVFEEGVDGVLGQSWLIRHDYLLDYRSLRVRIDPSPAGSGFRVPLRTADGRPVVVAMVDGQRRELVVDSGASTLILFEKSGSGWPAGQLETNGGSAAARRCTVRFALTDARDRRMDAVRMDVRDLGPGLLPASTFASVLVSNRLGFVQFAQ